MKDRTLTKPWNFLATGVSTDSFTPLGAALMGASVFLYAFIQVRALSTLTCKAAGPQVNSTKVLTVHADPLCTKTISTCRSNPEHFNATDVLLSPSTRFQQMTTYGHPAIRTSGLLACR